MVNEVLVGAATDAAARLLFELDRTGFPVDSMFWVQMPESGRWRLVIGSPLVRDQGQGVAYERLGVLFRQVDFGLSLMQVSVFDPDSAQLSSLLSVVEMSGQVVAGASWMTFGEGVVYRWNADAVEGDSTCELTQAELAQMWESERKLTNRPKLLFDVQGHHLIIRYHPQYGQLTGLSKIKAVFEIALHRLQPDCKIRWS